MTGRKRSPINHGTYGGAQTHRKRGESVCGACGEAEADYMRKLRARNAKVRRRDREMGEASRKARSALVELHPEEYAELYAHYLGAIRGIAS